MKQITPDTLASIEFEVTWNHGGVSHTDTYMARKVNFWRDCLPRGVCEAMMGKKAGDRVSLDLPAGLAAPRHDPGRIKALGLNRFETKRDDGRIVFPA